MEELWKETHLSSLHENPITTMSLFLDQNPNTRENPTARISQRDGHHPDDDDQDGILIVAEGKTEISHGVISTPCLMSSLNSPFEALAPSLLSCFSSKKKRVSEDKRLKGDDSKCDPRYKRMMKNRESAARSRARRQAYTSELEREHAELIEENAKLRKQQEKLQLFAEVPKKPTHKRSLSAPF